MKNVYGISIPFLLFPMLLSQVFAQPEPPRVLLQKNADKSVALNIISKPDGSFAFVDNNNLNGGPVVLEDENGQSVTLLPSLNYKATNQKGLPSRMILGRDGELYAVTTSRRQVDEGRKIGINIMLDIWFSKTTGGMSTRTEPKMIWEGYTGAIMEYQQLSNGRILVPFGAWIANCPCTPPIGCNESTVIYSDDKGQTWQQIENAIQSPCYAGYNGNNYGACEPVIEPLKDGSIWMLMRSQTGFLYESFSYNNGESWIEGQASRFNASHGPPALFRHKNGWLVMVWNNCELPPRLNGQGVYGGRDALHIAVSDDEGKTWRGFREIYRDSYRNETPPKKGDRGTAYPYGSYTQNGKLAIISGQGKGRRNVSLIEPEWVIADRASTDFSNGLYEWHVYKQFGPVQGWWRDRVAGCALVPNPTNPKTRSLHIRKQDDKEPDGAVWNFPNAWKGSLVARLMLRKGYQGGSICLNDRMFDPIDENGKRFSIFSVEPSNTYKIGTATLKPERWYDVTFTWDLSKDECLVSVNGQKTTLTLKNKTLNGISYVRFNSSANTIDTAGFLVDYVKVTIEDPSAPACTDKDKQLYEETYLNEFAPFWNQRTDEKKTEPKEPKDDKSPVEVGGKVLG